MEILLLQKKKPQNLKTTTERPIPAGAGTGLDPQQQQRHSKLLHYSLHPTWESINCPAIRNSDVHQCHRSHWTPIHISSCSFSFNIWPSVNSFTPHQQLHYWNYQHKYQCKGFSAPPRISPQFYSAWRKSSFCVTKPSSKNRTHFHFQLQKLVAGCWILLCCSGMSSTWSARRACQQTPP